MNNLENDVMPLRRENYFLQQDLYVITLGVHARPHYFYLMVAEPSQSLDLTNIENLVFKIIHMNGIKRQTRTREVRYLQQCQP